MKLETPSSKPQTPGKLQIPSFKIVRCGLQIEVGSFPGAWGLVLAGFEQAGFIHGLQS
jgi:hypothetical protein